MRSVRSVADAPESILDERMLLERNRGYFFAYRWLGMLTMGVGTALILFVVISDTRNTSVDEFYYQIEFTYPQIQALFWVIFGYAMMLPSISLAWLQSKRKSDKSFSEH
jgi:hypothetical protein